MMQECAPFFQDRTCEYFPCHKTADPDAFDCRFCYCPLYPLGEDCGGNFCYTETGIKDCSNCLLPHTPEGCRHMLELIPEGTASSEKEA